MKKTLFITAITLGLILGIIIAAGYSTIKRKTSDEAIKNRLLSTLRDFGEAEIDHAHIDFFEGITIDNLSFTGISENVQGKSIKIPKIVLKHDPRSLLKGQLKIDHTTIISPELTIEEPSGIWNLLNTIKTNFDKLKMPLYADVLHKGITIRDLKIRIKENKQRNTPEIILSGINVTFLPFAGSFQDIIIKGKINDEFLGNYVFSMNLHPHIPSLNLEVHARNLMVNETVLNRIPFAGEKLWNSYRPAGKINVSCNASFNNQNNQERMDYSITIDLNRLKALYKDWPFLIRDLTGSVILNPEKLYLKDVVGYLQNGDYTSQVEFNGEFGFSSPKKTFVITIPNLFINKAFLEKIPKIGEQVWPKIQPTGLVDIAFQYNKGEGQEKGTYFLVVDSKGLEIKPQDFPYPISYMNGQFKMADNILLLKNASGFIAYDNQPVFAELNGIYDIESGRRIFNIHVPNIFITEALFHALPDKSTGNGVWKTLKPRGRAEVVVHYQGFQDKKDDAYFVEIDLKDCEILITKHKIPVWGIEGRIEINKQRLVGKRIDAKCYGGRLEGDISITLNANSPRYKGELSIAEIHIEKLAHTIMKTKKPLAGILSGKINYQGEGTELKNLSAQGKVNVTEGYLSDVPIILNIFNFLSLNLPKKESFRDAQVKFIANKGKIHIHDGAISSDTIELNGRGDIDFDGRLHLSVVAEFDRNFFSQIPLVGKVYDFIVGGVRRQLTMVEVKGTFSKPEIHSIPFKPLTRSIRNLLDLLPPDKRKDSHQYN
ncbi:MAG: AsmA family protein [wastewater metagenome]|nr:AsmA family protein [Candidatus Loosdrechtia aerotolerans]